MDLEINLLSLPLPLDGHLLAAACRLVDAALRYNLQVFDTKVMKKKKLDAERQHEDYNDFKSNEDKDVSQCKKEEKKRKKKKLSEESKSKEYNEFESNEGEDDARGKKRKKKKLSEESKSKEYNEFESNEGEDDAQGKKRKKKKLSKESKSKEYNEFESKEGEDDAQGKKRKKKKLSKESKREEYNKFEGNEGEDDAQGKKRKKKKLSEESKSKEDNEFEGNEGEHDAQGKKRKEKKLSKESKSKEYNVFERNEGEEDVQGKKRKKKKLHEESKINESNEFESNEGEDDIPGKKMEEKKLHDKGKNKENSKFNSKEGDPPSARVNDVDSQSKKMEKKKKAKADNGESSNPAHSGLSKPKRVTFSDQVDVCCDGLIRGKRFTPEEDERIKLAVFYYIESHGLGDEGLDMVLHCNSHREIRNCWREIGAALPNRPYVSVYTRAHILFERDEKRKWTPEEYDFLRKIHEQHGSNWKAVADAMGKHRFHVKDAWRRIKLTNRNKGRWTQEEYQNLFNLVNEDLRARASQGYRKSKHGMLRDNIGWEAIGDKLATRTSVRCCMKWYDKLTSPMVASGTWSDTDDYRLVNALFTLDACCMEEVDWDNLLEHRPGDACRKRWNQMVQYIGEHGGRPFAEQVEILAKRFCPDLLEVREAYDAKPLDGKLTTDSKVKTKRQIISIRSLTSTVKIKDYNVQDQYLH
ncbi:unnamed protein product [Sphenostylis stenocarpa]|uniref:Cyclin-D-binding Myb-like transcription factor 1 n=1 Tax=Sphenostylis stenocarpa TaxID=92480 RepID=A0AA86SNU9_9FABA|nr:unnamed protein product [Sphenostylis stenocarpa]